MTNFCSDSQVKKKRLYCPKPSSNPHSNSLFECYIRAARRTLKSFRHAKSLRQHFHCGYSQAIQYPERLAKYCSKLLNYFLLLYFFFFLHWNGYKGRYPINIQMTLMRAMSIHDSILSRTHNVSPFLPLP